MSDDRAQLIEEIAATVRVCTLCDLHHSRTNAVPGAGSITTEIMFIGEGPGYNEDKQGLPFVGRSGDYLTKLIAMIGMTRDQVFITNVVKCRPPENRDPLPNEIAACKPYLDNQITLIDPLVIVTLGRHSMYRYFPGEKITQIQGKPKFDDEAMRAYMPMFHPAAVLRNPSLEPQMETAFKMLPRVIARVRQLRERKAAGDDSSDDGGKEKMPPIEAEEKPAKKDEPPQQLSLF